MKILRSKKALSPVIASIILIAVTVAVSIAVAAWMGALTIGFTNTSSITITNMIFKGSNGTTNNYIALTLKNTGTKQVTIGQAKVNNVATSFNGTSTLNPGVIGTFNVLSVDWSYGNPYKVDLFDTSGNAVGSNQQNALP
jgi:flagellin-like protein